MLGHDERLVLARGAVTWDKDDYVEDAGNIVVTWWFHGCDGGNDDNDDDDERLVLVRGAVPWDEDDYVEDAGGGDMRVSWWW